MRQETVSIYKFSELSDTVKETVVDDMRDINTEHDWYDFTYDDVKTIGKLIGIDIDRIYFSGFCSQGDGACFEGDYEYVKGSVKALKEYALIDTDLHVIATALYKLQRKNFYSLSAKVKHRGNYYHELCTDIDVFKNGEWTTDENESDLSDLLRSFMQWIYSRLQNEYDFLTSDTAIIETIENNDYEFWENGMMI